MLKLSISKIRLAALLAETAVKKSAEEITKNRTRSTFLHFARVLGVIRRYCFAYNGDVAVIVDNYVAEITHLPDDFAPAELVPEGQVWFDFEATEHLAKLLKSKNLEEQMMDANLCEKESEAGKIQLLAFNRKQSLTANSEEAPDRIPVENVIANLKKEKSAAGTSFSVNIRDLSRVCDYLKKVGDDFVELKIANDGKMLIFTSKTLEEKQPHVEVYLKIQWGELF